MQPNSFLFTITKACSAYRLHIANAFAEKGFSEITPDYFIVLEKLWENDNIGIGLLAQRVRKDSASVSRIIDGMSQKGLVKRVKSENDSRYSNIILTKKGFELEEKLKVIVDECHVNAMHGLSPIEIKELGRMLEHVFGNTKQ